MKPLIFCKYRNKQGMLFSVISMLILSTLAFGELPIIQLTNNDYDEDHPQISGGNVVWEGDDGNGWEIFFWDGSTITQLTDNDYVDDRMPQISGGNVVWQSEDYIQSDIYFYDGSTITNITNNSYYNGGPQVSGDNVVWGGWDGNDWEVYFWDGSTITQVTDNSFEHRYADISGNNITWRGWDDNDWEIFFWDGSTITQLTNNTSKDILPSISGSNVIWQGSDANDTEIYFWDGSTVTQLTDNDYSDSGLGISGDNVIWSGNDSNDWEVFIWDGSTITQLTDNDYDDFGSGISGNNIVWSGNDGNDYEVFIWDGSTITQLTDNDYDDRNPRISGNNIVWRGWDGNDWEIFLYEPLEVTAPVGNELWAKGQTYPIKWSTTNPSNNVKVQLFRGNTKVMGIKNPTVNDGACSWKIPTTVAKGTNYRIKVTCLADPPVYGFSDLFEICGPCDLYNSIQVSDPNSNTDWEMGQTYSIQWTGGEIDQNVKILLFKGSYPKKTITASTVNDGQYDFTVPYNLPPGSNYRIKVKVLGISCSSLVDLSEYFEIKAPPIDVSLPNNSTVWTMGQSGSVNWLSSVPGNVKIKLLKGNTVLKTISDKTANDGTHTWAKVPYNIPAGSNYRIKVISRVNNKIVGFSDTFTIEVPPIDAILPTSSTEWKRGYKHEIRWTGGKPNKYVAIYLYKAGVKVKTIKSSTINDGLFKWKVPVKLALGSDYSVEVVYLPNPADRDMSQNFAVINSPVGTWVQKGYIGGDGGVLKLNIKNNNTFSGYLSGSSRTFGISLKIPLKGTYSYDFDTGHFTASGKGSTVIYGVTVRLKLIGISGNCFDHKISGNISEIRITASQYGYSETESIYNGTLSLNRKLQ